MSWPFSVLLKNKSRQSQSSGFGLIELMVSISIMVIVAGIILSRQSSFNGAVLLRSQAYEIALKIREVQLGAVSASDTVGGANFRSVLGINFSTDTGLNKQYVLFRDLDGDETYQSLSDVTFGQRGVIDNRFYISLIEIDGTPQTDASVVFERPNFDAKFSAAGSEMLIHLRRVGSQISETGPGDLRIIEITTTGQISVR
jgi:prepilin-type N-terminal cleavage/methylation domain-containing protein